MALELIGNAVVDDRGRLVRSYGRQSAAETGILGIERKRQERIVPCISCAKPFKAEGRFNRMCNACRRAAREALS